MAIASSPWTFPDGRPRAAAPAAAPPGAPARTALKLLERTLNDLRVVTLVKAVGVLALGVVALVATLARDPEQVTISGIGPTGNLLVGLLLSGGAIAFSVYLLAQWHRARPARDLLFATLRDDPARVVWIYEVHVEHARTGTHLQTELYFGLVDGALLEITVARVHTEALRDGLQALCPGAVRGYSDALAQTFRSNPALLRGAERA